MIFIKINYKNIINKIIVSCCYFLMKSITLSLILMNFSIYGMEAEENRALKEMPEEILSTLFNHLDKGRVDPYDLLTPYQVESCPIPINDFIAAGMVCCRWRKINLSLRGRRILTISSTKKMISFEDYQALQDSGYKTLCLFSQSLIPEDVSYLNKCLAPFRNLALLPPKGTRAYKYPSPKLISPGNKYLRPDVIQSVGLLENLTSLYLPGNNLDADDTQYLSRLTNLVTLDLSCNNPKIEGLLSLVSLKKLNILKILSVEIDDDIKYEKYFVPQLPKCTIMVW